jgi:hypothetical protein
MRHKEHRLETLIRSNPSVDESVRIDLVELELLMHEREGVEEVFRHVVEDVPARVYAYFSEIVE